MYIAALSVLFFLAAARMVTANHSTCSWMPVEINKNPGHVGWYQFCTADLHGGETYTCREKSPAPYAKVADYGVIDQDILELCKFRLVARGRALWQTAQLTTKDSFAYVFTLSYSMRTRWLRRDQQQLEKHLPRSKLARLHHGWKK